jgi:hypothetical protein
MRQVKRKRFAAPDKPFNGDAIKKYDASTAKVR